MPDNTDYIFENYWSEDEDGNKEWEGVRAWGYSNKKDFLDRPKKQKDIVFKTVNCRIHDEYRIETHLNMPEEECEIAEGAIDAYLNSMGCTVCAAESIGATVENYIIHFVEKLWTLSPFFLKIAENMVITNRSKQAEIDKINRISYG